ncbi:MAG: cytochrome c oxidase assembly protein [Actinomycetota bacterium]
MTRSRFLSLAGVVVLLGAVLPPLHSAADERFSAHMVQHLLIMLVAPALFVWGSTRTARPSRLSPLLVAVVNLVVLWIWHLPRLYDAALDIPPLHVLEHVSFFVAGLLFWRVVAGRTEAGHPARVGLVFVTMLQSGALGALITFANGVLYRSHVSTTRGLSPLEDQQLAGVIMWVPAGAVYLIVLLALLAQMLRGYPQAAAVDEP